jgi:formate/nitrite transporter
MENRTPEEILAHISGSGCIRAQRKIPAALILAFFAGAFIAFAAQGSNMMAYNLLTNPDTYGLGRALSGAIFGTGLMLVVLAGGELVTGNALIIISVLDRKLKARRMLLSWLVVYAGNFMGSLFIAWMVYRSGLLDSSDGLLGGMVIKIAVHKTSLAFLPALLMGIMCNWLVCLAVWVSSGARDTAGKILAIFFIIGLFVISGYEHSVANMFYIPVGILAKQNPFWLEKANTAAAQLDGLNWITFFTKNLIPVTLGNMAGGSGMVGVLYWFSLGSSKPRK